MLLAVGTYFNTSNVTIQPPALKFLNQFLSNFNTSNVTIQPATV